MKKKEPMTTSSIVNWEIHHKINKTAEKASRRLKDLFSDKAPTIYPLSDKSKNEEESPDKE